MQRCLLRSQHRQVKGSLRACMGKGSFSSCRKHTFTSAFLSENPFGLPAIRLGCGRFISLKSANFSAEATASWLTACSQEFRRERVDQHTAACPEYQTANSRADSGSLLPGSPGASSALQEPFLSLHCRFSRRWLFCHHVSRWQKNVCNPAIYF